MSDPTIAENVRKILKDEERERQAAKSQDTAEKAAKEKAANDVKARLAFLQKRVDDGTATDTDRVELTITKNDLSRAAAREAAAKAPRTPQEEAIRAGLRQRVEAGTASITERLMLGMMDNPSPRNGAA